MKNKIGLLIISMFVFGVVTAQNMNRESAAIAWEDADELMYPQRYRKSSKPDMGAAKSKLIEAKKYIDLAASHEKTANDLKTLRYKTKIYFSISDHTEGSSIAEDASYHAMMSGLKYMKLDTRDSQIKEEVRGLLMNSAIRTFYMGADAYRAEQFDKAIELYESIMPVFEYDKNNDLKRNNVSNQQVWLYSSYAAKAKKDYPAARAYLNKLVESNYMDPKVYLTLVEISLKENDTTAALKYVEQGREMFENNTDLINYQLDIKLKQGKSDELLADLNEALELDPYRYDLLLIRALLNSKKSEYEAAEADLDKVIQDNPGHFKALYNMGVLYNNWAADIMEEGAAIKDNNKFMEVKSKADDKINKAIENFEKALVIEPTDIAIVGQLKQLYAQVSNSEKYNEMKEKEAEIKASRN